MSTPDSPRRSLFDVWRWLSRAIETLMLFLMVAGCSQQPQHQSAPPRVEEIPKLTGEVAFTLDDGEIRNREAPDTFQIPDLTTRQNLQPESLVKLIFNFSNASDSQVERMWVIVKERTDSGYVGILDNDPYCTDQFRAGHKVHFEPRHVIAVWVDQPAKETAN